MTRSVRPSPPRRCTALARYQQGAASVLAALLLWLGSGAYAENWTVQTVAVRDLRLGDAIAGELATLGFDAYTEFVMSDGHQWVRVRVGCFFERADADGIAALLRGRYTRDAVVVPRTPGSSDVPCLRREIGFVTPDRWRQVLPGAAAFEVEVDGVLGLIRYQEGGWRLLQEPATVALEPVASAQLGAFEEAKGLSRPYVARTLVDGGLRIFCAGRLLAQTEEVAIVELDGVVSACRHDDATTAAAP